MSRVYLVVEVRGHRFEFETESQNPGQHLDHQIDHVVKVVKAAIAEDCK